MKTSNTFKILTIFFLFIVTCTATGCGGGNSGNNNAGPEGNSGNNSAFNNAGSISLEWDSPINNADGSPLNDLAGYKIYYGTSSGSYTQSMDAGDTTIATIENLSSGTWCFVATAYNIDGNESDFSDQFCTTI